jgi:methylphosphotriester-DNA--protein-cysteine methyltransferase
MRNIREHKSSIAILLFALFAFLAVASQATEFWGSKNSNKYHYSTCRWAQKIKLNNLVAFSSPKEAQAAGYIPCKVCRPPMANGASQLKLSVIREYE